MKIVFVFQILLLTLHPQIKSHLKVGHQMSRKILRLNRVPLLVLPQNVWEKQGKEEPLILTMGRESMVIYRSFYEAIKNLPDEIRLAVHDAIMEYGLYGIEPDGLDAVSQSIFTLIKPQIDANNRRYENGKKGGRPRKPQVAENEKESEPVVMGNAIDEKPNKNQTETKPKPKNNLNETKSKPNVNVNVNDNDKEKNNSNKLELQKKKTKEEETLERRNLFYQSLIPFVEIYGKDMIRNFYDYWSEMNKSKSKMRWESEKTWELSRRLEYWSRRDSNYKSYQNGNSQDNRQRKEQERNERQSEALARIMRLRAQDEADSVEQIRDD